MCDTLCLVGSDRTLFAKNSDRPVGEPQVVEGHGPRRPGGDLRTQYLTVPDAGAARVVGSRPGWLWGFEHGVNEHRVAIGNEKIWTVDDPHAVPPALIGMDLVRLGLERARGADEALDVVTTLLERHGQGGSGEESGTEPYWSSFLIADPRSAWVLETSGTTWVAAPVDGGAAISNRVSIGTGWTRSSAGVEPGADFQRWRDPAAPVEIADLRLGTTRPCAARGAGDVSASDLVSVLRDHGAAPWGAVGSDPETAVAPPAEVADDWTGVTVCMHIAGYQATNAAMVADLPADPEEPARAWATLGSPCTGVFVPMFPPHEPPPVLADAATWHRFAAVRARIEAPTRPDDRQAALRAVRGVLGPLEVELWAEADDMAAVGDQKRVEAFGEDAGRRLLDALDRVDRLPA